MKRRQREFDLRDPVCQWLVDRGFWPEVEFGFNWGIADIVAGKFGPRPAPRKIPPVESVMTIELKLHDVAGVLAQCLNHRWHSELIYAAMPVDRYRKFRRQTKDKFADSGIGLLTVDGHTVEIAIAAAETEPGKIDARLREHVERKLWRRGRHNIIETGFLPESTTP